MSTSPDSYQLTLGLMTKYWIAGQAKTRLGAAIGFERAGEIHRLFVAHLCASLGHVADRNIACLSPDHIVEQFQTDLRSWGLEQAWMTIPQGDGHLGERMERWFIHTLRDDRSPSFEPPASPPRAILIGADCPRLEPRQILQAGQMLRTNDVVLGPAADGGYYLIGLRGPWVSHQAGFETLFRNMPWSTEQVLPITRERLQTAGLSFTELETREDVDTIVELNHLRASLETAGDQEANLRAGIERILNEDASCSDPPSKHLPIGFSHE